MKRIFVDEAVCIGCHLCEVYCQAVHSRSKDLVKAFNRESPPPVPRLRLEAKEPVSFSVHCRQCEEPACAYACLTGALQRDGETGMVLVDVERCIGCWTCILACPFGAIRRDMESGKIAKCDLCRSLGEDTPVCVSRCPNEALIYAEGQDSAITLPDRERAIR